MLPQINLQMATPEHSSSDNLILDLCGCCVNRLREGPGTEAWTVLFFPRVRLMGWAVGVGRGCAVKGL